MRGPMLPIMCGSINQCTSTQAFNSRLFIRLYYSGTGYSTADADGFGEYAGWLLTYVV